MLFPLVAEVCDSGCSVLKYPPAGVKGEELSSGTGIGVCSSSAMRPGSVASSDTIVAGPLTPKAKKIALTGFMIVALGKKNAHVHRSAVMHISFGGACDTTSVHTD